MRYRAPYDEDNVVGESPLEVRNEDIDGRDCEHQNDDEGAQYVLNLGDDYQ